MSKRATEFRRPLGAELARRVSEPRRFITYAATLNPWAPDAIVPLVAWTATPLETVLGVLLIVGWQTRWVAFASGVLLLLFALGLTAGTGIKTAFDASVFAASGFLLWTKEA